MTNPVAHKLFKEVVLLMYGKDCIICGCLACDIHHIEHKGMGGASLNVMYNPLNGAPCCRSCHEAVHSLASSLEREVHQGLPVTKGEVRYTSGAEALHAALPHLSEVSHITNPLQATTEAEVIKELKEMKATLE